MYGVGAHPLGEEEDVRIHPVGLNAFARLGVRAEIRGRFAELPREEVHRLEVDEEVASFAVLRRHSLLGGPEPLDVGGARHRRGDPRREHRRRGERDEPRERLAWGRSAAVSEPGDEEHPLVVHPGRDRVEVVRKPLRLRDERDDSAHRREPDRERPARHRAVEDEPDDDGARHERIPQRGCVPREREDLGEGPRPDEPVHRRHVGQRDPQERADVAEDQRIRERHERPADPPATNATRRSRIVARASLSTRSVTSWTIRKSANVGLPKQAMTLRAPATPRTPPPRPPAQGTPRPGPPRPETAPRPPPRWQGGGAERIWPCATSCSPRLGKRNQSQKLSRCARSQKM